MTEAIDLTGERSLAALDANYLAAFGSMMGSSARGAYGEWREVALVSCGAPIAQFNTAHLRPPYADVDSALAHADAFFLRAGFPYHVELRRSDTEACAAARERLLAAGFAPSGAPAPGMALAPLAAPPPLPPGLTIERVEGDAALDRFGRTACQGFGFPEQAGPVLLTPAYVHRPEVQAFLGRVDGEPVATSLLFVSGPIAGIYWVSTLPAARRKGYGEALTWAAVEAGRRAGCRLASLQASAMGRPVYARMGFAHVLDYERYARPESATPAGPAGSAGPTR